MINENSMIAENNNNIRKWIIFGFYGNGKHLLGSIEFYLLIFYFAQLNTHFLSIEKIVKNKYYYQLVNSPDLLFQYFL